MVLLAGTATRGVIADPIANTVTPPHSTNSAALLGQSKEDGKQETEKGNDAAQKNLGEHYGFLQTNRVTTMEQELNAAGAAGYRVVNAGPFGLVSGYIFGMNGQALAFLLEKSGPPAAYQYRVWGDTGSISLNGVGNKIAKKLADKLNAEAAAGFRLLPACTFSRWTLTFLAYGGGNNIICMEKPSSVPIKVYEYQVVHDGNLKKLHEKLEPFFQQGFTVVALDEATTNFAILERPAGDGSSPSAAASHTLPYTILITNRVSSMLKDMNEKARAGYRLRDVGFAANAHRVILQQEPNPKGVYEYESISFGDKELVRKIEENGKRGFRLCPRTLTTDLLMEKSPGSDLQYHYAIVSGESLTKVFAKIDDEKQQGFRLLGLVGGGIFLEKIEPAEAQAAKPVSP